MFTINLDLTNCARFNLNPISSSTLVKLASNKVKHEPRKTSRIMGKFSRPPKNLTLNPFSRVLFVNRENCKIIVSLVSGTKL